MIKENLRYANLKEIDSNHLPLTENDLSISEDYFDTAVDYLSRENYISEALGQIIELVYSKKGPYLTEKGENHLRANKCHSQDLQRDKRNKRMV
ncbi:YjcQ family protein [Lysinibacillus sphaericus]|uniref:YjcQ family protein n=1 Tax=Lysinibacillus sphaericus TaxID=1421 RepID=UPI0025A1874F|nr:YjcQ family protein [Lysinibacillus sphaericus]MDM5351557.1 YjcQ family protein [Lysinibacillus sphaericus]